MQLKHMKTLLAPQVSDMIQKLCDLGREATPCQRVS